MACCAKCGTLNADSAFYCSNCGAQLVPISMDNRPHYKRKGINVPFLIAGIAAFVVFLILGVFIINGHYGLYSNLLLLAMPIVSVSIPQWGKAPTKTCATTSSIAYICVEERLPASHTRKKEELLRKRELRSIYNSHYSD